MSSSESDDDSTIFAGLTFFVHGHWAGRTYGRVAREIKENGGRVVKDVTDIDLSHAVVSGQLWSKQGTVGADHTIRAIIAANEGNRSEEDEDQNRVWLLPLEWLEDSIQQGEKLEERKFDFERSDDVRRAERAKELAAERKEYGGKSRFGRGGRRRFEREQAVKQELAIQAKIDKEGKSLGLDAFSGIASVPAASPKQEPLELKPDSSAPTAAENKDKAARAAERRAKEKKADAAAPLVDSKPLPGGTGDKKLKPKPKSRSSAPKIPIIPDSSDDDLPLVVGASDPGAPSTAAAAGMAKKRDAEVLMVSSGTESDDVRAVKLKKKKKKREVSPEL